MRLRRRRRDRISSTAELYDRVRALRDDLDAAGEHLKAEGLTDALQGGSTSGEIFGNLRAELRALAQTEAACALGLEIRIADLLHALDEALGAS